MKPEKQNLIRDLLNEDSGRETMLLAGGQILRRRRQWRTVKRGVCGLAVVALAVILVLKKETPQPAALQVAGVAPKAAPVAKAQALTDDELLGLFPDTPVALASLPDGKKRLIFPRPGDEQKFITRL